MSKDPKGILFRILRMILRIFKDQACFQEVSITQIRMILRILKSLVRALRMILRILKNLE